MLSPIVQGVGLTFPQRKIQLFNRTGSTLTEGNVVQIDLSGGQSESVTFEPTGAEDSMWGQAVAPAAAYLGYGVFAILMDASLADNGRGTFILEGVANGQYSNGGGGPAVGDGFGPRTTGNLDAAPGATTKAIAIALEAGSGATGTIKVYFNGIAGLGVNS